MHGKIDSIRNKINHFFPLSREYLPLDQSIYEAKKQQLLDEFNKHLGEPFDFIPYSEILLGRLEGSSG